MYVESWQGNLKMEGIKKIGNQLEGLGEPHSQFSSLENDSAIWAKLCNNCYVTKIKYAYTCLLGSHTFFNECE